MIFKWEFCLDERKITPKIMRLFAEYLLNLKSNGVVSALSNIKVTFLNTLVGLRIARIPLDQRPIFQLKAATAKMHTKMSYICVFLLKLSSALFL